MAFPPQNASQLQDLINTVPWTNARGLVTGAELNQVLTGVADLFGYVSPKALSVALRATPGTADQTQQLYETGSAWALTSATTFGAQYPSLTSQPLYWPANLWTGNLSIPTPGTGSVIYGDGVDSRLQGISFSINQNRSDIRSLSLTGSGAYGLWFNGNGRRYSLISELYIRDKTVGILFDGTGSADNFSNLIIENCTTGIQVNQSLGMQLSNIDMLNVLTGFDFRNIGEVKMVNCRCVGGNLPLWIRGNTLAPAVESYFTQCTFTNAARRSIPIVSYSNDGSGNTKFVLATKISCTIKNAGTILTGGITSVSGNTAASGRLGYGTNNIIPALSVGTISSVTANDVSLISAPVPFTTSFSVTSTNLAAAINANTPSTGYSAVTNGGGIYLNAPLSLGASANGIAYTLTTTGDLYSSLPGYISLNYSSPHGLNVGDDAWFDTGIYTGQHAIRYVQSSTVAIAEMNYGGSDVSGLAWVIPRLIAGQSSVQISYTVSGVTNVLALNIISVDDTSITTNYPFSSFPTLSLPGPAITVPGWDVILEATDTASTRVNDMYFTGGNINSLLIKSAYNVSFVNTRIKQAIWIDYRANSNFRSDRIQFRRPSRGRGNDPLDTTNVFITIPVAGSQTGWMDISDENDTNNPTPGATYQTFRSPNNTLPLIGWIPQLNEMRVTETDLEWYVGSAKMALTPTTLTTTSALYASQQLAVPTDTAITITPPQTGGTLIFGTGNGQAARSGIFSFAAVATPSCTVLSTSAGTTMAVTTGILNGTTGTAGKITVSAASNGNIYIENRSGGTQNFKWLFLGL